MKNINLLHVSAPWSKRLPEDGTLRSRKHVGENTYNKLHFIKCLNLVDVSTAHNICQGLRYSISVTSYREHSPNPDVDGPVKNLLQHYVKVRHDAECITCTTVYGALCFTCRVGSIRTCGSEEASLLLRLPFTQPNYIRFTVGVTWRATVILRKDAITSYKLKPKVKRVPVPNRAQSNSRIAGCILGRGTIHKWLLPQ
jgi:hypothetical protein